jgi:hypothetical protein
MSHNIIVIGPHDKNRYPKHYTVINTTSHNTYDWQIQLSPFILGPVDLYDNIISVNMENGWQFSKCYSEYGSLQDENPTLAYQSWAYRGWNDIKAHRYPLGRDRKPLYAWWKGEKLGYIEARKKIYIPLYIQAVLKREAFIKLKQLHKERDLALFDYDGYMSPLFEKSMEEIINDSSKPMGHAFILKGLLENFDFSKI